jgi:phosphonatase-like hydrolase
MVELVIFDIAGTTIKDDQFVKKVLATTVRPYVANLDTHLLDHVMGWPKPKALKYLIEKSLHKVIDTSFVEDLNKAFVNQMISFFQDGNNLQEIPGTEETFKILKSHGIKIALDTGFSRPIADVIIKKLGWDNGVLDATVASDEVHHGRPAPDMIYHLMDQLNIIDPKNIAKVGDTESDIRQGQNAGCGIVVGVTSGSCTRIELQRYKADFVVDSVRELPDILFTSK